MFLEITLDRETLKRVSFLPSSRKKTYFSLKNRSIFSVAYDRTTKRLWMAVAMTNHKVRALNKRLPLFGN